MQTPVDLPAIQEAIYRFALSLDSFLVNGIQYGVLQHVASEGFLERAAGNVVRDLVHLEEMAQPDLPARQTRVTEMLSVLRAKCQQLIDLVRGLGSFRTLSHEELQQAVSQIPALREGCVQRIQEIEGCFQTPKPFYQSRPVHSTATVDGFLADLERLFEEQWSVSGGVPH
jgi:hypothetical protein